MSEWDVARSRRWFLETVAQKKGFDPLLVSSWHSFLGSQKPAQLDRVNMENAYYGNALFVNIIVDTFENLQQV